MNNCKKTPLFQQHLSCGGKMVDFGGWSLPVHFGSQIEEHHAVRKKSGIFDVSHMTVTDIQGEQTMEFLQFLLANDIRKAQHQSGKAIYSCLLNENAGIIDDLIVYYIDAQFCRLVTNAGTRTTVMAWLQKQATSFDIKIIEQPELALVAVQGPLAIKMCQSHLETTLSTPIQNLSRFQGVFFEHQKQSCFVGRTGYTGEDGVEFIINSQTAQHIWEILTNAGVQPCGLGARDTLRLESAMALYGNDLDPQHTPLECGLSWTVSRKDTRNFIGKNALENAPKFKKINLFLQDKGILRAGQTLHAQDENIGIITSGGFSPTLEKSIAMARINANNEIKIGDNIQVMIRNKLLQAKVVANPFVLNGQSNII